jgi:hypothetical protein
VTGPSSSAMPSGSGLSADHQQAHCGRRAELSSGWLARGGDPGDVEEADRRYPALHVLSTHGRPGEDVDSAPRRRPGWKVRSIADRPGIEDE